MGNLLFETTSENTFEEYFSFTKTVVRSMKVMLIYRLALIVGSLGYATMKFLQEDLFGGITFLVAAILMVVIYRVVLKKKARKYWESNKIMKDSVSQIHFYEDRVKQVNAAGTTQIPYDKLYKIIEDKEHFYILMAKNQGIIINKGNCDEKLIAFILKLRENKNI